MDNHEKLSLFRNAMKRSAGLSDMNSDAKRRRTFSNNTGGGPSVNRVVGGYQNGGMSYIDQTHYGMYYDPDPICDQLVSSHDASDWIDHIYDDN